MAISSGSSIRAGPVLPPPRISIIRVAASRPLSKSGWRTVVSPAERAASMSSKPITDNSPGTSRPSSSAASSTPSACVSEWAKTPVGRSRRVEELDGELAGDVAVVLALAYELGVEGMARGLELRGEAELAPLAGVEPEAGVGDVTDVADALVAEGQQMSRGEAPPGHVIDDHAEEAGDVRVDDDDGDGTLPQLAAFLVARAERDDEQAVGQSRVTPRGRSATAGPRSGRR